ncbi:protocatechuate 3,4-dioxygenase subunit alpha [Gemmatimonadetes bacterium T265]|nr:protocatechuate 3,4-dioxygenase subunit alpha [Gemmatimonadetes bacterium T265]
MTARAATPGLTGSQTVGPFFHDCLMRADARRDVLAPGGTPGTRIRVEGRVLDGDGVGVEDAMLEVWQADHLGRYHHPADPRVGPLLDQSMEGAFTGFGRVATDAAGRFELTTVKPGAVPFDAAVDGTRAQAPHLNLAVFARGLLNHLFTRVYFDDEAANADDPVLALVPAGRRGTLVAQLVEGRASEPAVDRAYRFDVVLQGSDAAAETVFFDVPGAASRG